MKRLLTATLIVVLTCAMKAQPSSSSTISGRREEAKALRACAQMVLNQLKDLKIPNTRDLRFEGKWRAGHPKLVKWLDEFTARVPAFEKTRVAA